mgnify:CR=1 FL=1
MSELCLKVNDLTMSMGELFMGGLSMDITLTPMDATPTSVAMDITTPVARNTTWTPMAMDVS